MPRPTPCAPSPGDDLTVLKQLLTEAEWVTGPATDTYAGTGDSDNKILRLLERLREIAHHAADHRDRRNQRDRNPRTPYGGTFRGKRKDRIEGSKPCPPP